MDQLGGFTLTVKAQAATGSGRDGSGGKLNPLGNTTRAEAAVFLYRIYNK